MFVCVFPQDIKADKQTKADTIAVLLGKIRNYERIQESLVKKILSVRSDCDRLCLKLSVYEGNRRVVCRFRESAAMSFNPITFVSNNNNNNGNNNGNNGSSGTTIATLQNRTAFQFNSQMFE